MDLAIAHFSKVIEIDPTISDAWKRRGQTNSAAGYDQQGLEDVTKAIKICKAEEDKSDMYYQRGIIHHKTKDFRKVYIIYWKVNTPYYCLKKRK